MTPEQYIADHIVTCSPSSSCKPKAWADYKARVASYLVDIEGYGVAEMAKRMGYCDDCKCEGVVGVTFSAFRGIEEVPCRDCSAVDIMGAWKTEVEG